MDDDPYRRRSTDHPGRNPMSTQQIDQNVLMSFVFRAVDEVGATLNAASVVLGDELGWYRARAGREPLTPTELAEATGPAVPYAREWLNGQAAGSFLTFDAEDGRYS